MTRALRTGGLEQIKKNYVCTPEEFNGGITIYLAENYEELKVKSGFFQGFEYLNKDGNRVDVISTPGCGIFHDNQRRGLGFFENHIIINISDNRQEVIKGLEEILKK